MTWGEAWELMKALASDTSSRLGAKLAGHDRPWPVEAWLLANVYDLLAVANSKRRPPPYPRPDDATRKKRVGRPALPQHRIRAALAARGHK